jgi:class 3 adenylate cyclase
MSGFTVADFGQTVRADYERGPQAEGRSMQASAEKSWRAGRALGHPDFADMMVGERRSAKIACVFLDLTNFTARTFWDSAAETTRLAHAVSTGFIEVVAQFGGFPLGLRGDGLFAAFGPGDPDVDIGLALAASAMALDGVQSQVNPWLSSAGMEPIQARAGVDYGDVTFVRSGSDGGSEVNQIGFAANFAAKCEKHANSWEVVVGQGLAERLSPDLVAVHPKSPKAYTRGGVTKTYRFYHYRWQRLLPMLPSIGQQVAGVPTTKIKIG